MRFDDVHDGESRRSQNKLALIRLVFDKFVLNCYKSFKPTDYWTTDEQLVACKCFFRQYMPKNPAKYAIKIYALVVASNFYATKLEVYVGKQPKGPFEVSNVTEDLACRLVVPVVGSHRNITAVNFFFSVPMLKRLLEEKDLSYVGTIKKNKPEIAECFLRDKDRVLKSSLFRSKKNSTLVLYVPSKRKAVCAISSMHYTNTIDADTEEEKNPCIFTINNNTKHGVTYWTKCAGNMMCRDTLIDGP